jgi:hypothetical protein
VGFIFFVGHQHFKAGLSFDCVNLKETKGKFKKEMGLDNLIFVVCAWGEGCETLKIEL